MRSWIIKYLIQKIESHGKNYPPIHPNDRCTTVAEFDDDTMEGLQRRARDENGKPILVPKDMNYNEWKEKYVTSNDNLLKNIPNNDRINKNKDKKEERMNYQDITNQYNIKKHYQIKKQKYFIDDNGIKYNIDGRHVLLKTTQDEREIADILGQTFGGKIRLVPVVLQPKGIQTPDYIVNNKKFDLKQIVGNGKNTLDTAINKKKKQSNNFIFDISKSEMEIEQALSQIHRIYNAKNRTWVNTIVLVKNKSVLKVFKRK